MVYSLLIVLLLCHYSDGETFTKGSDENNNRDISSEIQDDRRASECITKFKDLTRFETLPGIGWDNLRNTEEALVFNFNYSQCHTTDDGRYLLPDYVFTIPIKSSRMNEFAELFDHWHEYKSTTSNSVNVHAGLSLKTFGISGSFSREKTSVRDKQSRDFSSTTRVQLRYDQYSAKLQPGMKLHPIFKDKLLRIAMFEETNNTVMAQYESQLLVRDFGTHVVTSVDAGAILEQVDQIKSTFAKSYSMDSTKVTASASASFGHIFNIGSSFSHSTTTEITDQYLGNRTHSVTKTYGGPAFRPNNFSINDWIDGLTGNLVAVDRSGDPLHYLVSTTNLPEVPTMIVYQTSERVKDAINQYYKQNTYKGCMEADSPNFNFQANVEDGSCTDATNNYTFGGVYQTCHQNGNLGKDLCSTMTQKNPLTGQFSCPAGYEPVSLHRGTHSESTSRQHCHRSWFHRKCRNDVYTGTAYYEAFWCVAKGPVQKDTGFLFGGVFTSTTINLLTQTHACPLYFQALRLLGDLSVCVSDDYNLGYEFAVPFAGFFSCDSGNPLKLDSDEQEHKLQTSDQLMLKTFILAAGPSHWPRGCPTGFSEHLAVVKDSCEIEFCIQSNALKQRILPVVKRPPFMQPPSVGFAGDEVAMYSVSNDGLQWNVVEDALPESAPGGSPRGNNNEADSTIGTGATVAISILSVAVVGLLVLLIVMHLRKGRKNEARYLGSEAANLIPESRQESEQYGTNGTAQC